jgi:hypothetical protein
LADLMADVKDGPTAGQWEATKAARSDVPRVVESESRPAVWKAEMWVAWSVVGTAGCSVVLSALQLVTVSAALRVGHWVWRTAVPKAVCSDCCWELTAVGHSVGSTVVVKAVMKVYSVAARKGERWVVY